MNDSGRQLHYGTAGWSYKDWNGIVYPSPLPPYFNQLEFLSQWFQFVEVNTSFYRIPSLKLTSGWVNKTAHIPHFSFWIKIHQNFTHQRILDPLEIKAFKESLAPLVDAKKLTGLLAQFPYSFRYNKDSMRYLQCLSDAFHEYPMAVEFRKTDWGNQQVVDFFRQNELIFVNIDQPPVSQSIHLTDYMTHPDITYFRLHGRNAQSWFSNEGRDARYDYDYSMKELGDIAAKIKKLTEKAKKIFVSGNNHYKGQAIKNLNELKKLLSKP